jgi:hypothetical protein
MTLLIALIRTQQLMKDQSPWRQGRNCRSWSWTKGMDGRKFATLMGTWALYQRHTLSATYMNSNRRKPYGLLLYRRSLSFFTISVIPFLSKQARLIPSPCMLERACWISVWLQGAFIFVFIHLAREWNTSQKNNKSLSMLSSSSALACILKVLVAIGICYIHHLFLHFL